jgi:hypothetical protein
VHYTSKKIRSKSGLPRRRGLLVLAGILGAACLGAGVGDVLYVNRVSVPIRNGKFAFNKVLVTAVQGDKLTVTGVDGSWLKVKYVPKSDDPSRTPPPVEGYVMEDALSARQVTAATTGGPNSATEVASAGASRGWLDSGKYAAAKGLNPDPFYKMVTDSRASVNDKAFDQFTSDGQIGPRKPKPAAGPL